MKFSRIILAIIVVNALGVTLSYFGINTYFIFLGFRFHIGCILPFLLLLKKENLELLWEALKKPRFSKKFVPAVWVIFSLVLVVLISYLLKIIRPGDPDYFYEFGLSSIFDYPLYLVWNFPQLLMLFMVMVVFAGRKKISYMKVFLGLILLFGFEFIPFNGVFSLLSTVTFILAALTASFFVTRLQNVYWFSFIVFSSVWSIFLLLGSSSELMINIFFAREYNGWEGFFEVGKQYSPYIIPSFFFILLTNVSFYAMMSRQK